ncbi:MAG: CBS domain-containing protein [Caldilineales bacterium]|nr:CBS domain-containing protein [Caldilineales bacterium]
MNKTVRQLLQEKGGQVWSVAPDVMVLDALELMAAENIGSVVVVDGDRLAGILTERDYARKLVLQGKSSHTTPVSEIMSAHVLTVTLETSIDECMAIMTEKRLRHLPVVEGEKLVGLISIGDVVKAIITQQQFTIGQLERYIAGR